MFPSRRLILAVPLTFQNYLGNSREEVRESSALIYASTVVTTSSDAALQSAVSLLLKDLQEKSPNQEMQHGYLLTVGHILERKIASGAIIEPWNEFKESVLSIGLLFHLLNYLKQVF